MAGNAVLKIDVTADTGAAVGDLKKVESAVKGYGDAADTATKQSRDISGAIDKTGGVASQVTTGMRDLGGAMSEMGGTMGQVGAAMETSAIAFEALDGAATLYAAAQGIATGATTAFNVVMNILRTTILTNPIFIIAAILIAIGAAFVIAYQKCETFRNIVDKAFDLILGAVEAVWNWIKNNWPLLLAVLTGPFGAMVAIIIRHRDSIWDAIKAVWNWIRDAWDSITGWLTKPFEAAWGAIKSVFDRIRGAIDGVMDKLRSVKDFAGNVLDAINPFSLAVPSPFAAPSVTGVARTAATVPLASGGGGGVVINISGALDPDAVARQVERMLRARSRRVGGVGPLVGGIR